MADDVGVAVAASWDAAPIGLVHLSGDGTVERLNAAARTMLGDADASAVFAPAGEVVLVGDAERTVFCVVAGEQRALAYRRSTTSGPPSSTGPASVVAFRDITWHLRQQRRIAAVATTAAGVASGRSLPVSLDAVAREVARADGLAGVQILAADHRGDGLKVVGSAGFPHTPELYDLLLSCRDRGASLLMLDTFESGRPVVVPHRYADVMSDPAWEPVWETLRTPVWDAFVSMPLLAQARPIGVLNAFFSPGQHVDDDLLAFLRTMADQAAFALDYAELLERHRADARRAERQRLARELHDSVVQQVFSIGMQTEALKLLAARSDPTCWPRVMTVARELESTTRTALTDLRALVAQLHPTPPTDNGFCQALVELVATTQRRTDLAVALTCPASFNDLGDALAEDVYFVIAEALHNAAKHSRATCVDISLERDGDAGAIAVVVSDDGRGLAEVPDHPDGGYGFTSMRERAEHWRGTLDVRPAHPTGTSVVLHLPAGQTSPTVIGAAR